MSEIEEAGRTQRYCPSCDAQIRPGNTFCVSCGKRLNLEDATLPVIRGSGSRNRSHLDQGNTKIALYVAGALLLLIVAYLLLSYSVPFGFVLIGLSVLVVLVVRKTRGTQTRLEQRAFETAGRYGGSARKAHEEGKHREFAQKAYLQSKEAYEETSARYRDWSESRAAEREHRDVQAVSMKESTPARYPEWARNFLLLAVIVVGVLVVREIIPDSCIGCGGTDPKDKAHASHLSSMLKAGVSSVEERIKIEDVKVNRSSATVKVSGDVTGKDARYLCGYALDASRAFLKNGGGAGGRKEPILEAQVKRPGIFNDTTCER